MILVYDWPGHDSGVRLTLIIILVYTNVRLAPIMTGVRLAPIMILVFDQGWVMILYNWPRPRRVSCQHR